MQITKDGRSKSHLTSEYATHEEWVILEIKCMLEVNPRGHLAPQPLPSIKTYSNIKNSFFPCDMLRVS
jgi:hypothetical protein